MKTTYCVARKRPVEAGFTYVELLISVVVMSFVLLIANGLYSQIGALSSAAEGVEQAEYNQVISEGFLDWAQTENNLKLPLPFTDGEWTSAPIDPAGADADAVSLRAAMVARGLLIDQVMTNNKSRPSLRVYQMVPDLQLAVPINGQSGPTAIVEYDLGAIYMTSCRKGRADCDPNPGTGIPGDSVVFAASNIETWNTSGRDKGLVRFSTWPLQYEYLKKTKQRIDFLRDALRGYFNTMYLSVPPDPAVNHFPVPNGGGAPDFSGSDPAINDGCRDGWYDLSAVNVNVLDQVGLQPEIYGVTLWGAPMEYCRDYDIGQVGVDAPPHNAAIRIHREVSRAISPGAPGDNLVFGL